MAQESRLSIVLETRSAEQQARDLQQALIALERVGLGAARRWEAEVSGIDIGGMHVETDDRTNTLLNGAISRATIDPNHVRNWKMADGTFVMLDAETIIQVGVAVDTHVQACFDREADLLAAVAAGTITPVMLEEGWPGLVDYASMTVPELKALAAERQVSIPAGARKAQIIEALS